MRLGIAITGSFCTFKTVLGVFEKLAADYELIPIFSFATANYDTRFFKADDFRKRIIEISKTQPITTIVDAEPLGTREKLDAILVAPCTGNTLSKIAHGITDTPVTMAVKAHLRNGRPVIISVSSNDALGANARNIGTLLNVKNVYFVPFGQDSPELKRNSLIADTSKIPQSITAALEGKQIQPLFSI